MEDAFIGTICLWPVPRVPENYMYCQGQTLKIQEYPALFSIIGTTYGGDGTMNFALPDLRGRALYGCQTGATGDHSVTLGTFGGHTSVNITAANMPLHSHGVTYTQASGTYKVSGTPGNALPSSTSRLGSSPTNTVMYSNNAANATLISVTSPVTSTVDAAPGVQAYSLSTLPPSVVINYIICVQGLYPNFQ